MSKKITYRRIVTFKREKVKKVEKRGVPCTSISFPTDEELRIMIKKTYIWSNGRLAISLHKICGGSAIETSFIALALLYLCKKRRITQTALHAPEKGYGRDTNNLHIMKKQDFDFIVRAYGRTELAQMYSPELLPESAYRRLRRWIAYNPQLRSRFMKDGRMEKRRVFTPAEVRMIVDCLGEP